MKKLFTVICLVLAGIILFAFKSNNSHKISKSYLIGFWVVEDRSNSHVFSSMKVFEKDGSYYNVAFEKGKTIMTHKGKYKILDDSQYKEKVTDVRFNARWDLKNKEFVNNYELSKDKKELVLSGIVFSKTGTDSLKWSESYRRVEIPE